MPATAYTLAEARRIIPGQPTPRTLRRWMREGISGVRLGYGYAGGRRVVSGEEITRFLRAVAVARGAVLVQVASRDAQLREARQYLASHGFRF